MTANHSSSSGSTPRKPLTGRVPAEAIVAFDIPRLSADTLQGYRALEDLTGAVSDAMDNLGLAGAIPAGVLPPTIPTARMVGQAVTVQNIERPGGVASAVANGRNLMGEQEAYNLAEPGDVVVIQGIHGASNMGGQSASLAHRAGCAGAVIDGSYRDPDSSRDLKFPLWAASVSQITGKWRLQTAAINGPVLIKGIRVHAGDLVVADEAGVVFVPFARAADVLKEARKISDGDNKQKGDISSGVSLSQLAATKYK
jgi:4-hydroxy-4-methyl-2-oxoglutarate aldolase